MKILTTSVNNTVFIKLQYMLLKKYMPKNIEYEFIVFNDSKNFPDDTNGGNLNISLFIQDTCESLGIKCINIPNEHHKYIKNPSIRCANSMNFILKYQEDNPPDEYIILDCDMFPIAPINIEEYRKYNCALLLQSRQNKNYFWPGILYFNFHKMKDIKLMNWNCIPDFDTGGMMIQWLSLQDPNTIYYIDSLLSLCWDKKTIPEFLLQDDNIQYNNLINFIHNDPRNSKPDNKYFTEIYDNTFFHYRSGTNWRNEGFELHNTLTNKLFSLFNNE